MREYLKNMKISFFLAAILYIVLGLVLLIWPDITGNLVCFAFGLVLLIYGVITIISFFVHDSRQGSFRLELFLGIVAAGVGLVFLIRPDIVLSILPVVLGIYIVIDALLNLKRAIDLNRMGYPRWWVVLVLSLVSAVFGVLILCRPLFLADVIFMVIGAVLVYSGISDLWGLFKVGRVTKELCKLHPIEVDPIDIE